MLRPQSVVGGQCRLPGVSRVLHEGCWGYKCILGDQTGLLQSTESHITTSASGPIKVYLIVSAEYLESAGTHTRAAGPINYTGWSVQASLNLQGPIYELVGL